MKKYLTRAKEYAKLGNCEAAIANLSCFEGTKFEKYYFNLKSRYEALELENKTNRLSSSGYSIEKNKIIDAIFYFIEVIEKEDEIENDDLSFAKVFDDRFKRKLNTKGRELVKRVINQPLQNELFILAIIKDRKYCTFDSIEKDSGFKKPKILRIIRRLKRKRQILETKDGQLVAT